MKARIPGAPQGGRMNMMKQIQEMPQGVKEKCNIIKKVGVIVVTPEISPQLPVVYPNQSIPLKDQFDPIAYAHYNI